MVSCLEYSVHGRSLFWQVVELPEHGNQLADARHESKAFEG